MFRLNRWIVRLKYFMPVMLLNVYIVLYYVLRNNLTNYYVISVKDVFYYLLCVWGILFFLSVVLKQFLNYKKTAMALFMLFFGAFYFNNYIQLSSQPLLIFHDLTFSFFLLIPCYLLWKYTDKPIIFKILNFACLALLGICLLNNILPYYSYLKAKHTAAHTNAKLLKKDECPHFSGSKNFIFIVLDGHVAKQNIIEPYYLQKYLQFEKSLKEKGFYVAENSFSNYPFTLYSLPSMLNLNYLDDLSFRYQLNEFVAMSKYFYKHNLLAHLFKKNGYSVSLINDFNIVYNKFYKADHNYTSGKILTNMLFHDIHLLPLSLHSQFTDYAKACSFKHSLSLLKQVLKTNPSQPKFIFMHLLFPHEPYVFDEKGKITSSTYLAQMTYIDQIMQKEIDNLLAIQPNSIIVLMSDHGYYLNYERMANFLAFYIPDRNYSFIKSSSLSNVNTLRKILNQAFQCNFEILEDKFFYTNNWASHTPLERILLNPAQQVLTPYKETAFK